MVRIREATRSDNEALLSLTSMTPMSGHHSIRIDRQPDFFRLLDRRGRSHVLVAEEGGFIIGCVSVSQVLVHIDQRHESVHYLGDLKIHPHHRGTGLAVRLIKSIRDLLEADIDLVMCTVAHGNRNVLPLFDGRSGLPKPVALGTFNVFQILPSPRRPKTTTLTIREEPAHPDLVRLYNDYYGRYQLGPVFQTGSLHKSRHWVARSGGDIRAALSLVDVGDAKQIVLIRLPFRLRILVSFLRPLRHLFPIANLPEINHPIRILYIKSLACRKGQDKALDLLIQTARNVVLEQNYHFLTIGVHEKDPLRKRLTKYPKFNYKSMGFAVSLKRGTNGLLRLRQGIPYVDYSLF